ncbi:hypothetical protein T4D_1694 [Trichinella pseudospiralis]|uniref:Uncharacterized protein n=1 Tax=Trichinella pseudospiralis TaxID=6337 RepID=A0A0V1FR94_TRIPS|nr:hypothetical protein T4D_1694 [Trichinella pseudospiralis]
MVSDITQQFFSIKKSVAMIKQLIQQHFHFTAEAMRGAEMHAFPSATQLIRHMSFELNSRDHMFQAQIGYISNLQPTTFTVPHQHHHHVTAAADGKNCDISITA